VELSSCGPISGIKRGKEMNKIFLFFAPKTKGRKLSLLRPQCIDSKEQ